MQMGAISQSGAQPAVRLTAAPVRCLALPCKMILPLTPGHIKCHLTFEKWGWTIFYLVTFFMLTNCLYLVDFAGLLGTQSKLVALS